MAPTRSRKKQQAKAKQVNHNREANKKAQYEHTIEQIKQPEGKENEEEEAAVERGDEIR